MLIFFNANKSALAGLLIYSIRDNRHLTSLTSLESSKTLFFKTYFLFYSTNPPRNCDFGQLAIRDNDDNERIDNHYLPGLLSD